MDKQKGFLLLSFLLVFGLFAEKKVPPTHQSFIKWDINKDNKLTISELPKFAKRNFKRVDQNKDGSISLTEHITFLSSTNAKVENKDLQIIHNIAYAGNENSRQTLDLILPNNPDRKKRLPLVIWIHGGGWKNGDKKTGHSPDRIPALVKTHRYAGATISYRLSGEAIWPAQIHDCKAAIRWLRANAFKFGYDPSRIALWGSSAGGHLVSMLGTTGNNKEIEGTVGNHLDQTSHVQAVVNYYGPSALLQMSNHPSKIDHNAPDSPESQLMGFPIQESKSKTKQASPLHHVSAEDAPFIHFHGTEDPLVPFHQSKVFHQALKENGVPSTLITLQSGGHSMPGTFTQSLVIPFLDSILYQKGTPPTDQTEELK
jgi:acetyl esterase/lipase